MSIWHCSSAVRIINCTIVDNRCDNFTYGYGGAIENYGSAATKIINTIIWHNTALWGEMSGSYSASHSRISSDPGFSGAFHLGASSPCVNTGDNSVVTEDTDLDDNTRIVGGTVDMGAYEKQ
jgi:hypothetical protein